MNGRTAKHLPVQSAEQRLDTPAADDRHADTSLEGFFPADSMKSKIGVIP
jgi:hypothetical protein